MLAQAKKSSQSGSQDDLAEKLFGDLDSDGSGSLSLSETGLSSDLFNSIDADGDGTVTQTELQKAIETQRKAMLTNMQLGTQDQGTAQSSAAQKPDAQELLASIMNGQMPQPPTQNSSTSTSGDKSDDLISKLFSDLDADGSSGLSLEETGLSQSAFDAMDTNQDGSVSADELAAAMEKQRQAMSGSGQAHKGEHGGGSGNMAQNLFSDLDTDGSSSLSRDETGLSQSVFDAMDTNQDGSVSADELAAAMEKQRQAMGAGMGQQASKTAMAQSFLTNIANSAYQAASQTGAVEQSMETTA